MKNTAFINNIEFLKARWDSTYGDRLNELVIIGQHLDKNSIDNDLNSCLCTEEEAEKWKNHKEIFTDKWPYNLILTEMK